MQAVKFADTDDAMVEGLAAPWSGPFNGRDLEGEHFSVKTNFALDWFAERPLLFDHGTDPEAQISVVGRVKSWQIKSDMGLWVQAQLDKSSKYFDGIKKLIEQGKLYFSTGAMAHLVDVDRKSGEIKRWPWAELSLTTTPCNLLAELDFVTKHYKSAGLELPPAVKAAAPKTGYNPDDNEFGATRSDFGYIDSDGRGHLPLHDAAHVRAAMARFTQTEGIPADKKKAVARKILAAARRFKIDVSDDSDVAMAAKAFAFAALRAMMEGDDSSGGFVAGGDGTGDDGEDDLGGAEPDSDDHPAVVRHAHTHADGTRHSHPHLHDQGQGSHDTNAHGHPVPVPDAYKATKAMGSYEGSYEDLRDDLAALLNPSGPFGASGYTSVVCTYPGYCVACRYDDGDEPTYWKVDYTLGDDGEPALGAATQVEQTWVPVKALSAPGPLTLDAHDTARRAAALDSRAKALIERRRQERRPPLSAANRAALDATARGLASAGTALRSYLDLSEELSRAEARADALASPAARLRELEILELEIAAYTA